MQIAHPEASQRDVTSFCIHPGEKEGHACKNRSSQAWCQRVTCQCRGVEIGPCGHLYYCLKSNDEKRGGGPCLCDRQGLSQNCASQLKQH